MATGASTVEEALEKLRCSISTTDEIMFRDTNLAGLWETIRNIEKEQRLHEELRFMRRIEPFIDTLTAYTTVIDTLCQGYSPMAFVWGPIKLIFMLAKNHFKVIDTVLQAYSKIASVLPRIDRLKAIFDDDDDFKRATALIYSDILEFHERSYKIFRRKAWQLWFAVHWGQFGRRLQTIIDRLSMHCDALDKEATISHFAKMKAHADRCQLEDDAFERRRHNQMLQDVLIWLAESEDDQEDHLRRLCDGRMVGTCNWVLEEAHMHQWIEEHSGAESLWMTGIPGSGKSYLCSFLIEHLHTRKDQSCLYYFCAHYASAEATCSKILRTIFIQLLRQNPDAAILVHERFLQSNSGRSISALEKMLVEIISSVKTTFIVVDGLDELRPSIQEDILKSLRALTRSQAQCKVLISSRLEPQIRRYMTKNHIQIREQTVNAIQIFIKEEVKYLQLRHPEMDQALGSLIESRLQERAKGMFLWVRLVKTMLDEKCSATEMEQALDQLPEGLDEAYHRILVRIAKDLSSYLKKRAMKILFWLCIARRPLTVDEILDGIALDLQQTELSKSTRCNDVERDIVGICAPLLETYNGDRLGLVHFSAKEYLIHPQSGPFVDQVQAHLAVTSSCMINLNSSLDLVPGLSALTDIDRETRTVKGMYGLHSYASEYWVDHLLEYFAGLDALDANALGLLEHLTAFSRVLRHVSSDLPPRNLIANADVARRAMQLLTPYPELRHLIASDRLRKARRSDASLKSDSLKNQQSSLLQADNTWLTLIDCRLTEISELLTSMDPHHLPPHIDINDHHDFVRRYKFSCRAVECGQFFKLRGERDAHENAHVISFPCNQCDFSARGFKSRKDLNKHMKTYHMSPEDQEIPTTLRSLVPTGGSLSIGSPRSISRPGRSSSWNEQGRTVLQRSFSQILKQTEAAITSDLNRKSETDINPSEKPDEFSLIRSKIASSAYDTLADFKDDIRGVLQASDVRGRIDIDFMCSSGLYTATSEFPNFTNDDLSQRNIAFNSDGENQATEKSTNTVETSDISAILNKLPEDGSETYWSLSEAREFPCLLERYGRQFASIADHLGTKTAEEVGQYFERIIASGSPSLGQIANEAELRLQHKGAASAECVTEETKIVSTQGTSFHVASTSFPAAQPLPDSNPPYTSGKVFETSFLSPDGSNQSQVIQGVSSTEAEKAESASKPKKRLPPRREMCQYCDKYPEGLRDEFVLRRHIERFHSATRMIWICEDISIGKNFLRGCKPCLTGKRYRTKRNAWKHLRDTHFTIGTSEHVLVRWTKEIEEPNPKRLRASEEVLPPDQRTSKRQKTDTRLMSFAPVVDSPLTIKVLPSMQSMPSKSTQGGAFSDMTSPSESESEEDRGKSSSSHTNPAHEGSVPSEFPSDISFDNILPRLNGEVYVGESEGPPHRKNRSLIRPDQVPRLPHLGPFRMTACQDQVDALYLRLDSATIGSANYESQLDKLTKLSQDLRTNLKDWQRDQAHAPLIPFSL
ncbi:uncharacterized protein KY384_003827 [Bacidia gigantensis]|uniref:uncharacterized protein n=1 Tax=Bacidia gigantensis TaxID=2732470 RepID=UPI001D0386E7|nr:uncharacterized protein KY384_003827 [Bacidia gigantensis]KAG8532186.1 hypothetical protein KY384_003827 [Bacidia gigantensis]